MCEHASAPFSGGMYVACARKGDASIEALFVSRHSSPACFELSRLLSQYKNGGSTKDALQTLWEEGGIPRLYRGVSFALVQGPLSRCARHVNVSSETTGESQQLPQRLPLGIYGLHVGLNSQAGTGESVAISRQHCMQFTPTALAKEGSEIPPLTWECWPCWRPSSQLDRYRYR